jgi:hypothetical protein
MAATSIFFIGIIASNARFASSPPAASASISARGVICHDRPAVLAPAARAFLAAVADDGVPVAVGLFLVGRRDLEGKRLAVLERRAAVEAEAGNAENGELDGQDLALLAARVGARCLVDGRDLAIRKCCRVEARRFERVLVVPETDRVLRLYVNALLAWSGRTFRFADSSVCSPRASSLQAIPSADSGANRMPRN